MTINVFIYVHCRYKYISTFFSNIFLCFLVLLSVLCLFFFILFTFFCIDCTGILLLHFPSITLEVLYYIYITLETWIFILVEVWVKFTFLFSFYRIITALEHFISYMYINSILLEELYSRNKNKVVLKTVTWRRSFKKLIRIKQKKEGMILRMSEKMAEMEDKYSPKMQFQ